MDTDLQLQIEYEHSEAETDISDSDDQTTFSDSEDDDQTFITRRQSKQFSQDSFMTTIGFFKLQSKEIIPLLQNESWDPTISVDLAKVRDALQTEHWLKSLLALGLRLKHLYCYTPKRPVLNFHQEEHKEHDYFLDLLLDDFTGWPIARSAEYLAQNLPVNCGEASYWLHVSKHGLKLVYYFYFLHDKRSYIYHFSDKKIVRGACDDNDLSRMCLKFLSRDASDVIGSKAGLTIHCYQAAIFKLLPFLTNLPTETKHSLRCQFGIDQAFNSNITRPCLRHVTEAAKEKCARKKWKAIERWVYQNELVCTSDADYFEINAVIIKPDRFGARYHVSIKFPDEDECEAQPYVDALTTLMIQWLGKCGFSNAFYKRLMKSLGKLGI